MKSFGNLGVVPNGVPIPADQILEGHAARLLILLSETGTKGRINGLTKLAKLDFFLRYPEFLAKVTGTATPDLVPEPTMIRFHYGPWDPRYYQILPYLESRGLINIKHSKQAYAFMLTHSGYTLVSRLRSQPELDTTFSQAQAVGKEFGHKSGTQLKNLVYSTFETEVSNLALGEYIHHA